jgi:hypothetical protein
VQHPKRPRALKKAQNRAPLSRPCLEQAIVLALFGICAPSSKAQIAHNPASKSSHTTPAVGQDSKYKTGKIQHEFGVWGGGSFLSSMVEGTVEDVKLGIFGLRYARVLTAGENIAFKYTVDAIPAAVLAFPDFELFRTGPGPFDFGVGKVRRTVYGAGLTPIGFEFDFRRRYRVQPFANLGGGFIYFTDPIPGSFGARFNFTLELGGGVQLVSPRRALRFGYKFHHISSAGRALNNPGFDSNVIYVGFSIFK